MPKAALGQVAHVALAGGHLEIGPQVLVDGLGLGRRFDDDQALFLPCSHRVAPQRSKEKRFVRSHLAAALNTPYRIAVVFPANSLQSLF